MTHRGLLVDLYGVVVSSPFDQLWNLAEMHGLDRELIVSAVLPGADGEGLRWIELERGLVCARVYWREISEGIARSTGLRIAEEELLEAFLSVEVSAQVVAACETVRDLGIRTAIVTNGFSPESGHPVLARLVPAFDEIINSSDVGYRKPERELYEIALNALGASPSRTVYLDETPIFVEGGAAMGLESLLVTNQDHAAQILREFVEMQRTGRGSLPRSWDESAAGRVER